MFTPRRKLWITTLCTVSLECRRFVAQLSKSALQTTTPLAEDLSNTGLWDYGRWAKKGSKRPKGDKNRVNIISPKLCDDVIEYMKPSLQRHAGCDILDVYPGAGLWSSKLHDVLQPRSHILLEPDDSLYRPFLQNLLDKPNTVLVPKSGIVWRDLNSVLDHDFLPYQKEATGINAPKRNDTLLVLANLSFHPKRRFAMFESVTQLVLYQFIASIRAASLFNKYGLIRMLVWVESSDRNGIVARSCQRRRRFTIEAELSTESITEITSPNEYSQWFIRDHGIDMASHKLALTRMANAGIEMPLHRQSEEVRQAISNDKMSQFTQPAVYNRPWRHEQAYLEKQFDSGALTAKSTDYSRLLHLRYRATREAKIADSVHNLLEMRDELASDYESGVGVTKEREEEWNSKVDALPLNSRKEFFLHRDNLHLFHQDPPVLAWDRRDREPLLVDDTEFFPNAPCSLLDIQPKAMSPLIRAMGPGTSRAGDMFELILRSMMAMGSDPVSKSIETVWPGAAEGVLPNCPSLVLLDNGGMPVGGHGELSARSLNQQQWLEILEAWMKWPFHPSLSELVARITEEGESDTEDDLVHFD